MLYLGRGMLFWRMDQVRRFRSSTTALRFEISRQIFDSGVSHSSFTDHSDILRQSSQHHEVPHNVEMVRSQIEIDPKEVIITSDKPLGKGAMGTAYRCMLRGNPYVVKVPNKVELRSSDKGVATRIFLWGQHALLFLVGGRRGETVLRRWWESCIRRRLPRKGKNLGEQYI